MIDKTVFVGKNDSPDVTVVNNVPYIVYESAVASHERTTKRLFFSLVFCIVLLFVSNAIWLYHWCQYDYISTETTYTQDGQGLNIIGDSNNVTDEENKDK